MTIPRSQPRRSDVVAADRGGDPGQGMVGEGNPGTGSLAQARHWSQVYREMLAMEEDLMERIQDLMTRQSPRTRQEVEITNVPVVTAQADRFRKRLGFWNARVFELTAVRP